MIASQVHNHRSTRQYASPKIAAPGVSEIIVPMPETNAAELTLPMLAHLSRQADNRWLTIIGPQMLPKSTLSDYGFNAVNVRTIASRSDAETLWVMWEALNNGTSAYVVGTFNNNKSIGSTERDCLQGACCSGNARALILTFQQ